MLTVPLWIQYRKWIPVYKRPVHYTMILQHWNPTYICTSCYRVHQGPTFKFSATLCSLVSSQALWPLKAGGEFSKFQITSSLCRRSRSKLWINLQSFHINLYKSRKRFYSFSSFPKELLRKKIMLSFDCPMLRIIFFTTARRLFINVSCL